ncbi:hypothetical protein EW146_g4336 [Bondarzewia mesenterica]|uniref:Uncharacterized protein n=1 Tax=Bondarzewia mesenterica TaxID=1095465 RepID=A0A4S4LVD0_9AGAM|nr:hypothetical protein EW146_g4336 [Bondarzewia mesenterica]
MRQIHSASDGGSDDENTYAAHQSRSAAWQDAKRSFRTLLDFDLSRTAAVDMENSLVDGHMRMVFLIPAYGGHVCAQDPFSLKRQLPSWT